MSQAESPLRVCKIDDGKVSRFYYHSAKWYSHKVYCTLGYRPIHSPCIQIIGVCIYTCISVAVLGPIVVLSVSEADSGGLGFRGFNPLRVFLLVSLTNGPTDLAFRGL